MLRSLFENNPGKGGKKRKRNFWLYSMGEFVLISLGILIALQVDNWNQVRQVRNLETVMLIELLENLKADLAKQLYMTDFLESYIPLNVSGLRESNEFRHNLLVSIRFNANHLTIYNAIKEELLVLIENIEKELI